MLARGIRSYHRPTRIEEAQDLAAQGDMLLGRRHARRSRADAVVPNVVDLVGLGLAGLSVEDEDLLIGAGTPCWTSPTRPPRTRSRRACCRSPVGPRCRPRLLRGMATIGGEAIAADPDSELVAALLALNAVFLVAHPEEPRESPALRFLSAPEKDLRAAACCAR